MAIRRVNPLRGNVPITDAKGNPTPMFQRLWQSLFLNDNQIATLDQLIDEIFGWTINAGTGLDGGGLVSSSPTIDLADTAVTPGTYGDASNVAQFTVDQQGRITAAADVPISASGGAARFAGASGAMDATINTDAAATKGVRFTPRVDITVDAVWAFIDQNATGDNYRGIIAELSDSTNTATVVSILGTTLAQSNGLTTTQIDRFPFSSPLSLTANTVYFAGVYFDQASGTAVCRLGGNSTTRHNPRMHAPVNQHGRFNYNTVGLSVSQAPTTALNDDNFAVALEGEYA